MNTHFLPSQNNPKAFTSEPLSPSQQHYQQCQQQIVKMVDALLVTKLMRLLYWVKWGTVTNVALVSL